MQTKINISGKLAYEQLLIKQHRRETKNFLVNLRSYPDYQIRAIMKHYDKSINTENIIKVHTHPTTQFLQYLCTGKLNDLYTFTSSKNI